MKSKKVFPLDAVESKKDLSKGTRKSKKVVPTPTDPTRSKKTVPMKAMKSKKVFPLETIRPTTALPTEDTIPKMVIPKENRKPRKTLPAEDTKSQSRPPMKNIRPKTALPPETRRPKTAVPTQAAEIKKSPPVVETMKSKKILPATTMRPKSGVPVETANRKKTLPADTMKSKKSLPAETMKSKKTLPLETVKSRKSARMETTTAKNKNAVPMESVTAKKKKAIPKKTMKPKKKKAVQKKATTPKKIHKVESYESESESMETEQSDIVETTTPKMTVPVEPTPLKRILPIESLTSQDLLQLEPMKQRKTLVSFERTLHNNILFGQEQPFAALPHKVRILDNRPVEYHSLRHIICPGNRYGHLGFPENRLEVAGYNFIITPNKGNREGLYRALAQALSMDESDFVYIRRKILDYILDNWGIYRWDIFVGYIDIVHELREDDLPEYKIQDIYRNHALYCQSGGTCIELHAASKIFQFNFGIMIKNSYTQFCVYNHREKFHDTNGVKYYFLLTGNAREDWHWEYLVPAEGSLVDIPNGPHFPIPKQVFVFSKYPETPSNEKFHECELFVDGPVVIAYKQKEFYYRLTSGNTLFHILAEMLYGNVGYFKLIKDYIKTRRKFLLKPILSASKKKNWPVKKHPHTRRSVNMNSSMTHVHLARKSIFYHRGDMTDLRIAASIYNFSFNVFGLDRMKNQFVVEYDCHEYSTEKDELSRPNTVVLNLLHKSDETMHSGGWFLLEESNTLKHVDPRDFSSPPVLNRYFRDKRITRQKSRIFQKNLPVLSDYESVPLYDFPKKKLSWYKRLMNKIMKPTPKPNPVVMLPKILNPTGTDADENTGILHVDPKYAKILELGSEVPYHMRRHWQFTHPDSLYHFVILDKTRPSTCLPLVAQKLAKMEIGILPDLAKEPSLVVIKEAVSSEESEAEDEEVEARLSRATVGLRGIKPAMYKRYIHT